MLNEYNEHTKKNIHILVTSLCNRHCKHCCNKQYDLNDIPYATEEELDNAENIFITGGEPFLFSNPNQIAFKLKNEHENIKNVYVYTNAYELSNYLRGKRYEDLCFIDGVTVSIKNKLDLKVFPAIAGNEYIQNLSSNWLYVFDDLEPEDHGNFIMIKRDWQEDFKPDPNSIFRKL